MVAAVFGCIFGIFGIFTIGAIFVPLAALCTAIAFLTGVFARRVSVLLMSIVSGCVTAIAFIVSPSAWLLFGGILLATQKASNAPSHSPDSTELPAAPLTTPAPNESSTQKTTPPPVNDLSDTPSPDDVQRGGVACSALIAISTPKLGDDGLKHSIVTCLNAGSGVVAMTLRDGTWSVDAPNHKEPSVGTTQPPATVSKETAIDLRCTPPPMFSGNAKDKVVVSYVSVQGFNWRVRHVFASGSTVDRAVQYGLHDASTPETIAWQGTLIHRPQLKMRGEIVKTDGDFTYRETIYDANKGGAIVMDANFNCQVNSTAPSPSGSQFVPLQELNLSAEPSNAGQH